MLEEFGLEGEHCHIINGHIPVKSKKGESPIKGGGKLLVIDGGFCKAYQKTTGIAGYTLIYNSNCLPPGVPRALLPDGRTPSGSNRDIASTSVIFERMEHRMKIAGDRRGPPAPGADRRSDVPGGRLPQRRHRGRPQGIAWEKARCVP